MNVIETILCDKNLTEDSRRTLKELKRTRPCVSCKHCSVYSYFTNDVEAYQNGNPFKNAHIHTRCLLPTPIRTYQLREPSDCRFFQSSD